MIKLYRFRTSLKIKKNFQLDWNNLKVTQKKS